MCLFVNSKVERQNIFYYILLLDDLKRNIIHILSTFLNAFLAHYFVSDNRSQNNL